MKRLNEMGENWFDARAGEHEKPPDVTDTPHPHPTPRKEKAPVSQTTHENLSTFHFVNFL